jgi:Undecaprenyl-phosphate glucose phosphotransferase
MLLRLKMYRLVLKATSYFLPFFAFGIGWPLWAIWAESVGRPVEYPYQGHFILVLFGSLLWALVAEHYNVTKLDELSRERTGARAASSAVAATGIVLLTVLYFARDAVFPRGLFVCWMFTLLILAMLLRAAFRCLCRKKLWSGHPTRLLIVGADEFARDAATRLQRLSFAPCLVVGYVRLPGQETAVEDAHIYDLEHLSALHRGDGIDEAVMAIHPAQFSRIPGIIKALEQLCLPARAIVDLGDGVVVRDRLFQLGRMQMLDLTTTPADLLDYALLKRVFDLCFSIVALLVTAPLMGMITILIRLTSRGPVFFVQWRVGLNGLPFKMYKFRTMRVSDSSESDIRWTSQGDSRRTWLGTFLRRTSLDELPQFVNVLKGDMSVVGPRPERPHFVKQFLQEIGRYNQRHCLKVGITGWAQVNGWRGDTSIEKRVEHDLYYLQNWSLTLDLRIILMTIFSQKIGKNAY